MPKPSVSLIINTYAQPEYLERVLRAMAAQSPDEIILADDGSDDETRRVFERWSVSRNFSTQHVWQEKNGFRRARILNAAITLAQGEYIVFLDGDTIPHPKFVADHRALARRGYFIQGHRVLVGEKGSRVFGLGDLSTDRITALLRGQLRGLKHIFRWIHPFRRVVPNIDGVRGCNLSIWRSDLVRVNGYDEAYVGWGCEDLDLALRLLNSGVQRLDVRGRSLCYHLWHPLADCSQLAKNHRLLEKTASRGHSTCKRGLNAHHAGHAGIVRKHAQVPPGRTAPALPGCLAFGTGETGG